MVAFNLPHKVFIRQFGERMKQKKKDAENNFLLQFTILTTVSAFHYIIFKQQTN